MAASSIDDAAQGESAFIGFGDTLMEHYITTVGEDNRIHTLLSHYK